MTKLGRPLLPSVKRRSEFLNTRLSTVELELIEAAAVLEGKNPATWSREVLIDRARSSVQARRAESPLPKPEQSMHLIPTLPRKSGLDQIQEAHEKLLQTQIEWSDRPVSDGQIHQAAISVLTRNAQLWPWPVDNCRLYFDADGNGTIKQAAVLFLAEAIRLERHCDSKKVTDGQRYTQKKELNKIWAAAQELRSTVDSLAAMLEATQTGSYTPDKSFFLPHVDVY